MFTSDSIGVFPDSRLIAAIKGGPNHGVKITACRDESDFDEEFIMEPGMLMNGYMNEADVRKMVKKVRGQARAPSVSAAMDFINSGRNNPEDLPEDMQDFPEEIDKFMSNIMKKRLITSGKFKYIPNTNKRDSIYVAGVSGSGKSYWIADYLKFYKKLFPDSKIYLFSEKLIEPIFDKFKMVRIAMKEADEDGQYILISDPIDPLTELDEGCLVIFDDVDSIRDKRLKKEIYSIAETIFKVGRARGMSVIMTSHSLSNYRETRDFISESNIKVLFPRCGSRHFSREFMKTYVGMSKKEIEKIYKLDTRSVSFHCDHPAWILSDHEISMVQ